ncbi:hypothetical protein [Streptomyces sp. NPDC017964]|uniref:hypothetical protein n=1 Tax=Streptomyces sp. NPDC017964 TaxID=3365022 RepID=UPI00378AA36F
MIILDTGAVKALATGHKALNLLAGNMATTPGDQLRIPALSLMQAEADEEHLPHRVLAFSSVVVDPLDTMAAATVGTMIRDGYGGPVNSARCSAQYRAWQVSGGASTPGHAGVWGRP